MEIVYIACEYCGGPLRVDHPNPVYDRLKYHPACKRAVDRERARGQRVGSSQVHARTCEECGQAFQAKRHDARTCSPRCRTRMHRRD
jgi:hypothetical protein